MKENEPAVLLVVDQVAFLFIHDMIARFATKPPPLLAPLYVFGPFLAYECLILFVLHRRSTVPTLAEKK